MLGIAVALAASIPLAHADQTDFLLQLDNEGVFYKDASDMKNQGKFVCTELRENWAISRIIDERRVFYDGNTSALIVRAAAQNLCPDMLPRLHALPAG